MEFEDGWLFDWINGCTLGLEHISGDDDNLAWAIVLSLFVVRITYIKTV